MERINKISHDGKIYRQHTPQDLVEAGVPQPAIDAALAGLRVNEIKAECSRRIYAIASREAQMNVATAASVASAKTASVRNDAENAVIVGAGAGVGWVAQMMAAVHTNASDPSIDFKADDVWPDCPAEAQAVYGQF